MRIAQIAPPWFTVPPTGYGGIERVVFDLTESLVNDGHEVILFAPAGSQTSAQLVPIAPRPLGLDLTQAQKSRHVLTATGIAYREALTLGAEIIHDHTDHAPKGRYPLPIVRTIHGPATDAAVSAYRAMTRRGDHFVAISGRQRDLFHAKAAQKYGSGDHIRFAGVVYNPIDVAAAPFYPAEKKQGYVAYLGRCHWEKSPDGAIRVAQAAGVPLMMALRVTTEEQSYFESVVRPLVLSIRNLAKFVGEVGGREKDELIGRAGAVLFPSPWEEPFGLVLAEAAARGTPVVSLARGSAPELIVDGVTGFLCADEEEMARAVPQAMALDPVACRSHAEATFDRVRIARQYHEIYQRILEDRTPQAHRAASVTDDVIQQGSTPALLNGGRRRLQNAQEANNERDSGSRPVEGVAPKSSSQGKSLPVPLHAGPGDGMVETGT